MERDNFPITGPLRAELLPVELAAQPDHIPAFTTVTSQSFLVILLNFNSIIFHSTVQLYLIVKPSQVCYCIHFKA